MALDRQTVDDYHKILERTLSEFKEECGKKARARTIYFVRRDRLRDAIVTIRRSVPARTPASPVPQGVDAGNWQKLIGNLAAAEKRLADEAKIVPLSTPAPPPSKAPSKNLSYVKRQRWRRHLKDRLKDVYGKDKGKQRYKLYEKLSAQVGKGMANTCSVLHKLDSGVTVDEMRGERAANRASGASGEDELTIAPAGAQQAQLQQAQSQQGGIAAFLWPTDKPIYARPAAIGGAVVVVGVIGWLLLSKPKKTAEPAKKPARKAAP